MTLTPSTSRAVYYGAMHDQRERDPIVSNVNRATVPMGRGFGLWQRMNPGVQLVWVDDAEGHPRALTPKQASVISYAQSMVDGPMLTMRAMAVQLGVNVSTVSRALAKAQAWGLLVYMVGRGRFAGLVIVRYVRDGGFLDHKRKAAKARVHGWYLAVQRRISRLEFNVAPYLIEEDRDGIYYLEHGHISTSTKGATLTAQLKPWTPAELRDAGII